MLLQGGVEVLSAVTNNFGALLFQAAVAVAGCVAEGRGCCRRVLKAGCWRSKMRMLVFRTSMRLRARLLFQTGRSCYLG